MTTETMGILAPAPPPTRPIPLCPISTLKSQISSTSPHARTLSPSAPNKPNFPRFQPKNEDRPKKQTQSNPIAAGVLSGAQRSRMDLPRPHRTHYPAAAHRRSGPR